MGNLVESKEELDKYDVSKSNKFSRQPSIKTVVKETTITSNKNVDSQIDKNNEVFLCEKSHFLVFKEEKYE